MAAAMLSSVPITIFWFGLWLPERWLSSFTHFIRLSRRTTRALERDRERSDYGQFAGEHDPHAGGTHSAAQACRSHLSLGHGGYRADLAGIITPADFGVEIRLA